MRERIWGDSATARTCNTLDRVLRVLQEGANWAYTARQSSTSACGKPTTPRPFALVAPLLGAALVAGAAGGFAFATVLTLSLAFKVSLGLWWAAAVQAYGRLQLDGWAGLFVLGVALLFLSRMREVPLAFPRLVPCGGPLLLWHAAVVGDLVHGRDAHVL